jgi:L-asparagine oxygenase
MQEHLAQSLQDTGFALLEGYRPGSSAADVVDLIGEVETLGTSGPVHLLRPALADTAPPNTYSGNYGLDAFPLHTDMAHWQVPPRFIMLRCLEGSAGIPTILADGLPIIKQIGESALVRSLVKARRPVQGKRSLLRLCERDHQGHLLRWDEKYILPASPAGERGMSQLRGALATARRLEVHLCRSGDTLVLDNWRMLHGRGNVPPDVLNRRIARAYFRSIH